MDKRFLITTSDPDGDLYIYLVTEEVWEGTNGPEDVPSSEDDGVELFNAVRGVVQYVRDMDIEIVDEWQTVAL